jgi:penicillin amidase
MSALTDLIAPAASGVLTWMGKERLPKINGSIKLPGLTAPVEILRDRWGIPHIYAVNDADLFFAQGFVHAQDRLFQMELNRRTAQGRLSELFGELALDTDRTARTFGFHRLGRADWANASASLREAIQAYTAGVNAYLQHPARKMPVEFTLLGHTPEPWQPEDSAAFSRVMIWQLSHAWYGELIRSRIMEKVGPQAAAELEITYPQGNPSTLPAGIEFNRLDPQGSLQHVGGPFLKRGLGSNAWAVSPEKSITGNAYLCNDMHLALGQPGLWYEVHLHGGSYDVTGVSLPGLPLVLVGHNRHIAWGMTLAYTDCEDLYVEQFDPANPRLYRVEDDWLEAELISETIRVKGRAQPHIENVHITRHGPIISDVVEHPQQRLAVCSMALRPNKAIEGWQQIDLAENWDDFVRAMHLIEAPQLNVAYADVENNIGYWVTGRTPIRTQGDGSLPAPGWDTAYDWSGEIPFEEMPHALNPEQGFIVTTNNRVVGEDYPYFLGNVWMNGYRARRLTDILESKAKLGADDFRAMHMDFTCLPGKEFIEQIKDFQSADADVNLALKELSAWDGVLSPVSVGGAVYEVTRYTLVRNLLESGLGEKLALQVMGQGFHPLLLASHEFYGHDTVALLRILKNPDSWWLEQAGGRSALLERSLKQTVGWLRSQLGADPAAWEWGRLHHAVFPHPLGLQKPLDKVFNRGPHPIGGDTDTPCQTAFHPDRPYDNNAWAPSWRQIIDMGDLSRSLAIFPPGQSGQLGSPHYDDLIQPWLKGEYHPMLWTRQQVEANLEGTLKLTP